MQFLDALYVADVSARVLSMGRPADNPLLDGVDDARGLRMFARRPAVQSLRFVWRSGDADARAALACRVAIWLGLGSDRVRALGVRVRDRERARARLVELPSGSWSTTQFNCEIASL